LIDSSGQELICVNRRGWESARQCAQYRELFE